MKTRNKVVLLALCMAAIIVVSVLGTMAYLTSTKELVNTFTVGNVKITLDEAVVDEYGETGVTTGRVEAVDGEEKGNEYKLLPGHTYTKDPTIHVVTGSEKCYLFVKVVNGISAYEVDANDGDTIHEQMLANGWVPVNGQTGVYVLTEKKTVDDVTTTVNKKVTAGTDVNVFGTFTIADDAPVDAIKTEDLAKLNIVVTAYAIQADGFENDDAATIWSKAGFGATNP